MKLKLLDFGVVQFKYHNGKEQWKPKARLEFVNNDDLEILNRYNAEIRGFYNYFSIANNCSELHTFKYIMEYSMYKTFALKYRTTVVKICKQYKRNGVFTVRYSLKHGKTAEGAFTARDSNARTLWKMPTSTSYRTTCRTQVLQAL